jgi:hypothetical protein
LENIYTDEGASAAGAGHGFDLNPILTTPVQAQAARRVQYFYTDEGASAAGAGHGFDLNPILTTPVSRKRRVGCNTSTPTKALRLRAPATVSTSMRS